MYRHLCSFHFRYSGLWLTVVMQCNPSLADAILWCVDGTSSMFRLFFTFEHDYKQTQTWNILSHCITVHFVPGVIHVWADTFNVAFFSPCNPKNRFCKLVSEAHEVLLRENGLTLNEIKEHDEGISRECLFVQVRLLLLQNECFRAPVGLVANVNLQKPSGTILNYWECVNMLCVWGGIVHRRRRKRGVHERIIVQKLEGRKMLKVYMYVEPMKSQGRFQFKDKRRNFPGIIIISGMHLNGKESWKA